MKRLATIAAALLVAGCGNFFPNPDNVVLPSGARTYSLGCNGMPQGGCERRAADVVALGRPADPTVVAVDVQIFPSGDYSIKWSDGTSTVLIVD